jgi:hypothetical protein
VATSWDQALANRVPLDLGAVADSTLDAKLAMAEVVLHSADRAYRRRQGLPEDQGLPGEETEDSGNRQRGPAEPPRSSPEPVSPATGPDSPDAELDTPYVRIIPTRTEPGSTDTEPDMPGYS